VHNRGGWLLVFRYSILYVSIGLQVYVKKGQKYYAGTVISRQEQLAA